LGGRWGGGGNPPLGGGAGGGGGGGCGGGGRGRGGGGVGWVGGGGGWVGGGGGRGGALGVSKPTAWVGVHSARAGVCECGWRTARCLSAGIEVVAAWALGGGDRPPIDPMDLVHVVKRSGNGYTGLNTGIMDQFASIFGEPRHALLLDCRSLEHRSIPLPLDDVTLVACHSGSPRKLETSAYNERRSQCDEAVAAIAAVHPEVASLRDVTPAMLTGVRDRLGDVPARRAEHIVEDLVEASRCASVMRWALLLGGPPPEGTLPPPDAMHALWNGPLECRLAILGSLSRP